MGFTVEEVGKNKENTLAIEENLLKQGLSQETTNAFINEIAPKISELKELCELHGVAILINAQVTKETGILAAWITDKGHDGFYPETMAGGCEAIRAGLTGKEVRRIVAANSLQGLLNLISGRGGDNE